MQSEGKQTAVLALLNNDDDDLTDHTAKQWRTGHKSTGQSHHSSVHHSVKVTTLISFCQLPAIYYL